jgi:hypothetical protein
MQNINDIALGFTLGVIASILLTLFIYLILKNKND